MSNNNFTFFFSKSKLSNCRFGISIPQKLVKKSVERNCYKRQIRSMLIQHLKKYNDSCQTSNKHFHYNLIIIIRLTYLSNDFIVNRESLYELLERVSN